jgi:hypothetical protein
VQLGGGGRAAGQDERLQRRQRLVRLVAGLLQPRGLLRGHAQPLALPAGGDRDVGADVEQIVLDPLQPLGMRNARHGQRHADLRVELVDRPVGLDPRVGLRHPAHVAQMRLATVAEARVDAGQVDGHRRLVV